MEDDGQKKRVFKLQANLSRNGSDRPVVLKGVSPADDAGQQEGSAPVTGSGSAGPGEPAAPVPKRKEDPFAGLHEAIGQKKRIAAGGGTDAGLTEEGAGPGTPDDPFADLHAAHRKKKRIAAGAGSVPGLTRAGADHGPEPPEDPFTALYEPYGQQEGSAAGAGSDSSVRREGAGQRSDIKEASLADLMVAARREQAVAEVSELHTAIDRKLDDFIVGNNELIDFILIALLSEGHILIEGTPGTAKTTIAKSIALLTGCSFNRIQGAIDLQPADMTGVRIFDPQTRDFSLRKGPIFTNILLADEINRVNPKSQSAFLEAMSERQATVDGTTIPLPVPFFVIATQNPFEYEGTFPLIEAQRDRFMISIQSSFLNPDEELDIIHRINARNLDWESFSGGLTPLMSSEKILHLIAVVQDVTIEPPVLQYIRDLIIATRTHPDVNLGVSSRASIALVRGGKAMAALQNRTYVIPDDIKRIAPAILSHRIILSREAEIGGLTRHQVLEEILTKVEVL